MSSTHEELTIETLAGGDAIKQVNHQICRVIENILDVATPATSKRSVILKIKFTPSEDRSQSNVEFGVEAKLATDCPGEDLVTIARRHKRGFVAKPQLDLDALLDVDKPDYDPETGEVVNLKKHNERNN